MKTKFITILFAVLATCTLMGLSHIAQAKSPQSCFDGYTYLNEGMYKKSIKKLSSCLRSGSLTKESRAIALYNRASAYYSSIEKLDNFKKIDKLLFKALDDIEKSIKLNPIGIPEAYCLQGWIWLDISWGGEGEEDLRKGMAMGAPKHLCEY